MPKMIQIRNVPDAVHRKLKARAAQQGRTLTDDLLEEVERLASIPTQDEMLARLGSLPRIRLKPTPTEILRKERDRR
jgi:plasmid stability protein